MSEFCTLLRTAMDAPTATDDESGAARAVYERFCEPQAATLLSGGGGHTDPDH